jgi:hypothetical protein
MAKIGISLNDVVRNFLEQFIIICKKYKNTDIDFDINEVKEFDLVKYFDFKSVDELNDFLYNDSPLEIFGHGKEIYIGLINKLNEFVIDIEDIGEHTIELVSRDINKAIPATLFFLSKTGCKVKNIRFVNSHKEEWDGIDILIAANPFVLDAKPDDKISVKVNTNYNQEVNSDFKIDSLIDLITSNKLFNEITNTPKTITTTYEKI